jgi:hypothetical protein
MSNQPDKISHRAQELEIYAPKTVGSTGGLAHVYAELLERGREGLCDRHCQIPSVEQVASWGGWFVS